MTWTQIPSACTVSTTGQAAPCPYGERATTAASSRRIGTCCSAISGACVAIGSAASTGDLGHPDAPAVVAAESQLEHERPAHLLAERRQIRLAMRRRRQVDPGRAGDAQIGQAGAHGGLVLGVTQRVRARVHLDAVGGQSCDVLVRDVFVVERDDVTTGRELPQHIEGAVVAHHDVGRHERGAVIGRRGQDAQRLPQGNCRLMGHTRQLPRSDHADDRQSGAGVHVARG